MTRVDATELPKELLDNTYWCSLIGLRREIHMHPEPGFEEVRTQRRIKEVLLNFAGIEESQIRTTAITGLVVDIQGTGAPKAEAQVKCIALRADVDALTMTEGNNGLPYRSKNEGVAHMCGHDGHITSIVGVAILLQKRRDRIPSNMTVRLFFQPAEESSPPGKGGFDYKRTGGGGAVPMIDEGCLKNVDEVWGWHNWPAWPLGKVIVTGGPMMAHTSFFDITITGRGGHGSQPHLCADPIVCGAAVVQSLQTIVSRSLPSAANAVVTIAKFISGERHNVISDTAKLSGTIRDVNDQHFATIQRRMSDICNSICKAYNCTAEVEISSLYPTLVCPQAGSEIIKRCAEKLTGPVALTPTEEGLPLMGGEDFAYYLKERPGGWFFLGTNELMLRGLAAYDGGEDTPRSNCICHNTQYDFNDNVLPRAIMMFVRIVEDRFGIDLYTQDEVLEAKFKLNAKATAAPASEPDAKRQRQA